MYYFNMSPQTDTDMNMEKTDLNNCFQVWHQNIRGLKDKLNKLKNVINTETSYIVCLSKLHLKEYGIENINIKHYVLGEKFCRKSLKNGGVCIFIHETIKYSTIALKEQDNEFCSIKVNLPVKNFIIITVYPSPSSNFKCFF